MDAVKIGQFLCALRKERRWTQQEAAARLGVTDKSISKWETARGLPDITVLPALAQLYGVTVDELLAGARRPAPEQNGAAAEPNGQREGPPAGARRAFRLFAIACAAEGAAVVLSGMLTALLNAYGAMTPHHEELAARYFGDAALAADWDAWGHAAAAWQEGLQSLSAGLLPLAAAMGLSFALLLPLWRAPEVFLLTWPNLYLYWFLALRATLVLYGIYLVLYLIFKSQFDFVFPALGP